ncbi:MAG: HD family hydrolase [Pseudomonadota bacterium]
MLSGRRLDLADPSPLDVEIDDIAHGLARVARWNGQTIGAHPFSVAQHSLVVVDILQSLDAVSRRKAGRPAALGLAALLHDAPEYVIGDMISPFKALLGDSYRQIEARLASAIFVRHGLPAQLPDAWQKLIKRADRACALLEATQLAGFEPTEATKFFGKLPPALHDVTLEPMPPEEAAQAFLNRHRRLNASFLAEGDD